MFFNSIRFRLQLWYGIILIFVLSGFGFTAYQLERAREFRDLDAELNRRVSAITLALRPPPRERGPGERRAGPPPFEDPRPDGPPPRPNNRPFHNGAPEDFSPRLREFILPPQQERLFGGNETNSFYYIIWTRDGDEVSRSTNAPVDVSKPAGFLAAQTPEIRMRGAWREILFATPNRETILIGRSAAAELAELRRVLWRFFGVGGVIALLGLAGGWWIATRAIHPIEDISRTAGKIAAGDLTQRINIADMDTELGQLAGVLNSTFARLDAAFAQQTRFTADAAHELRTPVAVMLTQTQSALSRERSAADYRETIEACQRATQRMRRLIETLMVLARLDSGQETLQRTRFDLAQAVPRVRGICQTARCGAWNPIRVCPQPRGMRRGFRSNRAGHHQPSDQRHSLQQGKRAGKTQHPAGRRHRDSGHCRYRARNIHRGSPSHFRPILSR